MYSLHLFEEGVNYINYMCMSVCILHLPIKYLQLKGDGAVVHMEETQEKKACIYMYCSMYAVNIVSRISWEGRSNLGVAVYACV